MTINSPKNAADDKGSAEIGWLDTRIFIGGLLIIAVILGVTHSEAIKQVLTGVRGAVAKITKQKTPLTKAEIDKLIDSLRVRGGGCKPIKGIDDNLYIITDNIQVTMGNNETCVATATSENRIKTDIDINQRQCRQLIGLCN